MLTYKNKNNKEIKEGESTVEEVNTAVLAPSSKVVTNEVVAKEVEAPIKLENRKLADELEDIKASAIAKVDETSKLLEDVGSFSVCGGLSTPPSTPHSQRNATAHEHPGKDPRNDRQVLDQIYPRSLSAVLVEVASSKWLWCPPPVGTFRSNDGNEPLGKRMTECSPCNEGPPQDLPPRSSKKLGPKQTSSCLSASQKYRPSSSACACST